jgi:predicted nucleotidyltransferase
MRDTVKRVIDPFLAETDAALGGGYSAVLFGSAARGDYVEGRSDINLLLILDDVSPERLRALQKPFAGWTKAAQEPPLLISREEWRTATDVFPIEITDMQSAAQVLRGADPIAGLQVRPADLRHALEKELHGKLLRLRQGYVALAEDPERLGAMLSRATSTVLVLLRGVLRLAGRTASPDPAAVVSAAAELVGFPPRALGAAIERRADRGWRCSPAEGAAFLDAVARTAQYVDQHQPGDHHA